jgi:hypothetical protein
MSENGIRGIDLFKIAGESISGWIPSWKTGGQKPTRQLVNKVKTGSGPL